MSFKMGCPHCKRVLHVTETAFGKTVPCPGCGLPVDVPQPAQASTARPANNSSPRPDAGRDGHGRPHSSSAPPKTPPLPQEESRFNSIDESSRNPASAAMPKVFQGLNVADMFAGNEKEFVFPLVPGEERLADLTIHHLHLFFVKSGVTRVTLTTRRLLCTETRVFSPLYWLLLVLLPPLLFYYVFRIMRNRNIALPLGSIDSIEKHYHPNWLWFALVIGVGYVIAAIAGAAAGNGIVQVNPVLVMWLVFGVLGPLVLILMLATRSVAIKVVTHNNSFGVWYNPADFGVNEKTFDEFLKAVHVQVELVRALESRPVAKPAKQDIPSREPAQFV
jgi:hypothetical protein